jgi:outer membrane protein assembly factor BamA
VGVTVALLVFVTLFSQADAKGEAPAKASTEINIVPVAGGDSDVGIGGGVIGDLARLDPAYKPFRWRLEVAGFITFKLDENKKIISPFQDYYLLLSVPQLTSSKRLRLEFRPSYTLESTQRFYGIGNASLKPPGDTTVDRYQYQRARVTMLVSARVRMMGRFMLRAGADYSQNWMDIHQGSLLDELRTNGPERVRHLLEGPLDHGVAAATLGLEYDSRDDEIVTTTGSFHSVRVRVSPRLGAGQPFGYTNLLANFRLYRSPFRWLHVGARLIGDVLLGSPPFYELTRIEDMSMVGGGKGIRGVVGQRYYGKAKVVGNLEVQVPVAHHDFFGKPFTLYVAGFADGGRVWAELHSNPDLDGRGLGLKYGLGGGLRLQEGKTFVLRADLAWSPDGEPVGAYFNAGNIF